jgi:trimeric autotransporter adhesin
MKLRHGILTASAFVAILLAGCGEDSNNREPASIEILPPQSTIAQGSAKEFAATGVYSDNTIHDITTQVTWSSTATDVATISNETSSEGHAASLVTGTTTISATFGNISGQAALTVIPLPQSGGLVSIEVTPSPAVTYTDKEFQFTATGTYSDASSQDITEIVTWKASGNSWTGSISNQPGSQGLALCGDEPGMGTISATSGLIVGSTTLFCRS